MNVVFVLCNKQMKSDNNINQQLNVIPLTAFNASIICYHAKQFHSHVNFDSMKYTQFAFHKLMVEKQTFDCLNFDLEVCIIGITLEFKHLKSIENFSCVPLKHCCTFCTIYMYQEVGVSFCIYKCESFVPYTKSKHVYDCHKLMMWCGGW